MSIKAYLQKVLDVYTVKRRAYYAECASPCSNRVGAIDLLGQTLFIPPCDGFVHAFHNNGSSQTVPQILDLRDDVSLLRSCTTFFSDGFYGVTIPVVKGGHVTLPECPLETLVFIPRKGSV